MESVHPSGRGRQPALWLGSFVAKRTCNRTMVMWAASSMSIRSSNVLPILGRDSQGTSRTREGQTCCKELPACTTHLRDERHAGSTEATAGEEKHIRVRIEVSDHDISSSRTREKGKRHVSSGSPQTRSRTPSVLVWYQDEDVNYYRPDRSRQCTPSQ